MVTLPGPIVSAAWLAEQLEQARRAGSARGGPPAWRAFLSVAGLSPNAFAYRASVAEYECHAIGTRSDELLTGYELQRVSHTAAAVAIVDVLLRVGGEEIEGAMRWMRHGEEGVAVAPNEPGRWGLMTWTKWGMIQERRTE